MTNDLIFPAPLPANLPIEGGGRLPVNRIFCVGRNYEAHAAEMGSVVDREEPFWFIKGAYTTTQSGATVPYPPGTKNYHHEIELVVVLHKGGFHVRAEDANGLILGYAAGLDMTRRDLQTNARAKGLPWDTSKNFEHAAVFGPIALASRIGHPTTGRITLNVNGATKQDADLADLAWKIPELIAHLSTLYHLQPGDIIMTGTPAGVGAVVAGDVLQGEIAGVGSVKLTIAPPEGA
jgi:fumarylpyruvate hydrolase